MSSEFVSMNYNPCENCPKKNGKKYCSSPSACPANIFAENYLEAVNKNKRGSWPDVPDEILFAMLRARGYGGELRQTKIINV